MLKKGFFFSLSLSFKKKVFQVRIFCDIFSLHNQRCTSLKDLIKDTLLKSEWKKEQKSKASCGIRTHDLRIMCSPAVLQPLPPFSGAIKRSWSLESNGPGLNPLKNCVLFHFLGKSAALNHLFMDTQLRRKKVQQAINQRDSNLGTSWLQGCVLPLCYGLCDSLTLNCEEPGLKL